MRLTFRVGSSEGTGKCHRAGLLHVVHFYFSDFFIPASVSALLSDTWLFGDGFRETTGLHAYDFPSACTFYILGLLWLDQRLYTPRYDFSPPFLFSSCSTSYVP
jgi:hypothetical protein